MKALAFSLISVSFMSLVLTACGSKDDEEEAAPTSTYTYEANTQAIIDKNCATSDCHGKGNSARNTELTSLAQIKPVAAEMAKRIKATDSSVMPQDEPNFKNTDEGKILLDWLAGGADLK
ncbi:MAG TPA: hypothetical protein VFO10_06870 [Oligoflexus sp.]|uniref:hypothetical protein n=1 Tax=Oligoflexus sp. TaxID=1971216 RepID=UPI002D806203|nr:hypothetical protein [Oligoflexus sp.]HET9236954.1 hypothetical protein [Oligoflexus sp.]